MYYVENTTSTNMEDLKTQKDEVLIKKIQSGEKDLYSLIMDRYEEKILRYSNYLVNDEHKAVDIVQESFIKAYVNLNSFDTAKKFSSWLYRIVHNESINVLKKYNKEVPLLDDIDFKSEENTELEFEQRENAARIQKCLHEIHLMYSEPLTLFYLEEKSYEEISDILQLPMGTVATRISRAKIIMKKICQKN